MKRLTKTVLACVLAIATVIPAVASDKEPIKIGALFNLVGGMSSIDVPALRGVQLYTKQVNDAGGILGGRKIELLIQDTKTDQKSSAVGAKKVLSEGVVAGIGHDDPAFVLPAAALFQAKGIPYVTPGATLPTMPAMVGDCLFMAPFGDDDQAFAIAEYTVKKLGLKKIVVWTDNSMDFTLTVARFYKQRIKELGAELLLEDFFKTGDRDFSSQIARLKKANADAVFISCIPNEAGITIKQIREAGLDLPIIGADGSDTELLTTVPSKEHASNIYISTHTYREDPRPEVIAFVEAYTKEYGVGPENAFAALGYDGMGLLVEGFKNAGSTDKVALKNALAATNGYPGVTGTISYTRPSGVPVKPVAIMSVQNAKFKVEEIWMPKID